MQTTKYLIPTEVITDKVFAIRGENVMLDRDLAKLYGVSTKVLNQAMKRNIERFPADFMFRLTNKEKTEPVTICDRFKPLRHSSSLPYAFTEQGIGVLRSKKAVQVNIVIMRVFVRLRKMLSTHKDFAYELRDLKRRMDGKDNEIQIIFKEIKKIMIVEKNLSSQ